MANPYTKGQESITQAEHVSPAKTGDNIDAKRVVNYVWNGSSWQRDSGSAQVAERYDYSSSTTIYVGRAPIGTSAGSTGWTITKYNLASSSDASGLIATDVSWTNRAAGSYA